jgi:hypothetical protein
MKETKEIFNKKRSKANFMSNKNKVRKPDWLWSLKEDQINVIIDQQDVLLMTGRFAVGALVQANSMCFQKGKETCPANVIYSEDEFFLNAPFLLQMIASNIYSTKNKTDISDDLKEFSDIITDEKVRSFNIKLPSSIANDRNVYFTTILVERKHLPNKILSGSTLPMIVAPEKTDACNIIPFKYWSKKYKKEWIKND